MYCGVVLVCLVALGQAMPPSAVRMMEIEPAHQVGHSDFKLRFDSYEDTWEQFKTEHGKDYLGAEHDMRKGIFIENLKKIEAHNWKYFTMEKSYYLGVNQFADQTFEEYRQYNKLQKKQDVRKGNITCSQFMRPLNWALPESIDWREKGFVTPVKNQGQCGSCWSFSTTGSLEGQHFRKTQNLVSLSEQQLVDCSSTWGNQGCDGGLMDQAFEYIYNAGGLETEKKYPYDARDEQCKFEKSEVAATLVGCKDVPSGEEHALMEAVGSVGPVSVAIDAGHQSFQLYAGGVYDEPQCSSTQLDHGVLTVGYGSYEGTEFWLVKNSWGTSWGMKGYVRMSRNKGNQCGIATSASFPVV